MINHLTVTPENYETDEATDQEVAEAYEALDEYDPVPRTMLAYDGELIGGRDAIARYERDEQLQQKYDEAEAVLDEQQMTWSDVEKSLEQRLYK